MSKLYFRYGAMGSSKTANALMVRYNYIEKGKRVVLLKPEIENRDGKTKIRSRIGLEAECISANDYLKQVQKTQEVDADVIIIDEAQFLTTSQVDFFSNIVDVFHISVICYGLRTDFTGHLFDGSKRLMEIADVIEEIPTICWCGKKAQFNARINNGKIVRNGEQVLMGGNDKYVSLCRRHFLLGEVKGEE